MKISDGKRTVEIQVKSWSQWNGYTPDWSEDFFDAGLLPYDDETGVYYVDDVEYCIQQVKDYLNGEDEYRDSSEDEAAAHGFDSYAEYIQQADEQPVAIIDGVLYEFGCK